MRVLDRDCALVMEMNEASLVGLVLWVLPYSEAGTDKSMAQMWDTS